MGGIEGSGIHMAPRRHPNASESQGHTEADAPPGPIYGARSPKPTTLLLVHGPSEPEAIARQYQTTAVMPPPLAMGKDERGQYRTAPLKEYPPGLCKCLTALVRTALQESQARPQEKCTSSLTEFPALAQLHDELEGQSQQEMGPDYNAQALEAMR